MQSQELLKLDISATAEALARKEVTSEEITRLCLERISKHNKDVGAILWSDPEVTITQARESDNRRRDGASLGVLDGIPIAIKDMILDKDFLGTAASKIDRKSTRLNSSHLKLSRMPSSA